MSDKEGKCLCSNIKVTCSELPRNVIACYCLERQKSSGVGPSFNIIFPEGKIQVTTGAASAFNMAADSGNSVERHFCSNCGSAVCSKLLTRTPWKVGLSNHIEDLELVANVWSSIGNKSSIINTEVKTFEKGA